MSTRNEFIAGLMLEAAELLKESAGANGAVHRYEKAKYEKTKSKNDAEDAIREKKRAAYEKLGYDAPDKYDKVNRDSESAHKKSMNFYDTHKGKPTYDKIWDVFTEKEHERRIAAKKSRSIIDGKRASSNPLTDEQKVLHNRINKRAALKEAVDLLYEKAVMCEDASEAEGYIEKAEELQKAIEDIPEETPVKTDDYDPDVNGGEGPELDHEEIKDLCGGDKEVMDLLLDDENKSVTVDADGSNNESILSW